MANMDPCPALFFVTVLFVVYALVKLLWYALRRPDLDEPREPAEPPDGPDLSTH